MMIGIGVDCVEISSFSEKVIQNETFIKKVFTPDEIEYCKSYAAPSEHFAVRWVAKEAVLKAFSSKKLNIFYDSIEILNDDNGKPYVRILKNILNNKFKIHISLSHSDTIAVAFVIICKN